jgi:hypothetical protein
MLAATDRAIMLHFIIHIVFCSFFIINKYCHPHHFLSGVTIIGSTKSCPLALLGRQPKRNGQCSTLQLIETTKVNNEEPFAWMRHAGRAAPDFSR